MAKLKKLIFLIFQSILFSVGKPFNFDQRYLKSDFIQKFLCTFNAHKYFESPLVASNLKY